MSEYTIQPFTRSHYPQLNVLAKAAFNSTLSKAAFEKKYNTVTLGHPVIGFVAVHTTTQTPAAFYGVFPLAVLLDGKKILAAQSGDTMTHPAHQRKGLFVQLAQKTFAACRAAGIVLVFGQPNQKSHHGLVNRLGFLPLDTIVQYDLKRRIKTFPLPKLMRKAGLFSAYLKYAHRVLKNHAVTAPANFTNPLPTTGGKVLRNAAYLHYKKEKDKFFLQLGDALFWLKLTDVLWIGDVADYTIITQQTLAQLQRLAFVLGYNTIRFHLNREAGRPAFLQQATASEAEVSCFLFLEATPSPRNFVLTSADFDTW